MNLAPEFNIFNHSAQGNPLKTMPVGLLLTTNVKK